MRIDDISCGTHYPGVATSNQCVSMQSNSQGLDAVAIIAMRCTVYRNRLTGWINVYQIWIDARQVAEEIPAHNSWLYRQ